MGDDIVTKLRWIVEEGLYSRGSAYDDTLINAAAEIERLREERDDWQAAYHKAFSELGEAADEIERLRAKNAALYEANHQAMWDDTLIPIANAFGIDLNDEYGVPRRQFQMVDAIIKGGRRG